MANPSSRKISPEDIAKARANTARQSSYGAVVTSVKTCPKTNAAVVIVEKNNALGSTKIAYGFKPGVYRQINRAIPVVSAHDEMAALNTFLAYLKAKKDEKKAPHTITIGAIIAETWGVTMQGVRFYKVVGIPTPRTIAVVSLESRHDSGDWMNGTVVPVDIPLEDASTVPALTKKVEMKDGKPVVQTGSSIARAGVWNGKPVAIWSD